MSKENNNLITDLHLEDLNHRDIIILLLINNIDIIGYVHITDIFIL